MKRFVFVLFALLLIPCLALAEFAESSSVYDPALAQRALQIAETTYSPSLQAAIVSLDGFETVGNFNYVRPENDTRHVATYSVYEKPLDGGTAVIITIRGTGDGEWPLNMDLMPSGDYSLSYAENFYLAADDILTTNADYLDALENPVFLITGHSRGAAVGNMLAARLTDRFGAENVFAYTFATPRTVRGEYPEYSNIFNIINPADVITYLPFPQWGFERYGVDLILPTDSGDAELEAKAEAAYLERSDISGRFSTFPVEITQTLVAEMAALVPGTAEDLAMRHALTHTGEAAADEPGMTASDFFLALFSGQLTSGTGSSPELAALTGSQNDFTPLLQTMQSLKEYDSKGLTAAHMPATYGAWMTVMAEQNP